jgi:hypothetical protein
MARIAVVSFGPRFYRCTSCGARRKRRTFGQWEAAKGPADNQHYDPRKSGSSWVFEPELDDGESHGFKAIDSLVRNQRHRREMG